MKSIVDSIVVLSRINYGEADRIITVLTKEHGKLTLITKGVRRPKSKLAGGIELFTINEISYIPGKNGMATLVSSRMKHSFENIVKRCEASQDMFSVLQWLGKHLEDDTGSEYYGLLQQTLNIANIQSLPVDHAFTWFFVRALELSGHSLEIFRSADGTKLVDSENYSFDHDTASFYEKEDGPYTKDHIKLLRLIASVDLENFIKVSVPHELIGQVRALVERHVKLSF